MLFDKCTTRMENVPSTIQAAEVHVPHMHMAWNSFQYIRHLCWIISLSLTFCSPWGCLGLRGWDEESHGPPWERSKGCQASCQQCQGSCSQAQGASSSSKACNCGVGWWWWRRWDWVTPWWWWVWGWLIYVTYHFLQMCCSNSPGSCHSTSAHHDLILNGMWIWSMVRTADVSHVSDYQYQSSKTICTIKLLLPYRFQFGPSCFWTQVFRVLLWTARTNFCGEVVEVSCLLTPNRLPFILGNMIKPIVIYGVHSFHLNGKWSWNSRKWLALNLHVMKKRFHHNLMVAALGILKALLIFASDLFTYVLCPCRGVHSRGNEWTDSNHIMKYYT